MVKSSWGVKHKIFISKTVLPSISYAKITDNIQRGNYLTVLDLGDIYCIEVPYEALLNKNKDKLEYICLYF